MEKIKKVIFTFTGECRPAKQGESFFDNGIYRTWSNGFSTTDSYNICTLKVIEEQWRPKSEEEYYYIADLESGTINGTFFYLDSDYDKKKYTSGNCFRTRESAEAKLKEIKEILLK